MNSIDEYFIFWELLSSSRELTAEIIHMIRTGELSNEDGITAARDVLRQREAVDTHDLDGQRRLSAEFRRRTAELRADEKSE
jgi:hypothetical protein